MANVKEVLETRHNLLAETLHQSYGASLPDFEFFNYFYTESHRSYHNLEHLQQMFMLHDQLYTDSPLSKKECMMIELFIWWHDIIYNPRRKDNEEMSAVMFQTFAHTPSFMLPKVYNAILHSKHTDKFESAEPWELYALDLDLSAMANTTSFIINGSKIRMEYKHLDEETFYTGRKKFFTDLLSQGTVFYNPYNLTFYNKGEAQLKLNIKMDLDLIAARGF